MAFVLGSIFCLYVPGPVSSCLLRCRYSCISPLIVFTPPSFWFVFALIPADFCGWTQILQLFIHLRVRRSPCYPVTWPPLYGKKSFQNPNSGRNYYFCSHYCKGRRLITGLDCLDCQEEHISRCGKPFN